MAKEKLRKISSSELEKILREHQLWNESLRKEGEMANLKEADLSGFDLSGAKLAEANLERADFEGARLAGADLEGANLERTIFVGADLSEANLQGAKLLMTKLSRANLKGANLSKAKLIKADLSVASLVGVELRNADLFDSVLIGANLSHIKIAGLNFKSSDFTRIKIDYETVSRLPQEVVNLYGKSFIILGYTNDLNKIVRSIEFPPEYHQAGISILNYFGTVLRKKFPDQKARFRIEQEERKVTMIIDTEEGDREIIEKSLDEYGLVITGQMKPEQFTDDRQLLMELKTELRVAQVRIEIQKDIIEYQRSDITELHKLLDTGLRHPPPIQNIINLKIAPQISLIHGSLNELKEQLPQGSDEAKSVDELQQSLDHIEKANSPEQVAKSSGMSKFRRVINDMGDEDSNLGKTIRGIKKGTDIARDLADSYNKIAQWCGLPQVPEPFVKK